MPRGFQREPIDIEKGLMREIEFRGKRIGGGQWVYGFLDRIEGNYTIHNPNNYCRYEIAPETAGQYTGMKDGNSVKIFECDIIQTYKLSREKALVVVYRSAIFYIKSPREFCFLQSFAKISQVIGNIHDNPERLLEPVLEGGNND